MRIAIDARYVADHFPGIGRYVYNLLLALAQIDHQHTLVVLYNPALPNTRHAMAALARYPVIKIVAVGERPFTLAEQANIPRRLALAHIDLYHTPYYVRPYIGLPCPSIVTLYDVIPRRFPGEVPRGTRLLFDLLTRLAIRTSRQAIALSDSARADLIALYGTPTCGIAVTPLAADARFQPQPTAAIAALRQKHALPERYVLALSSNKPHKNLPRLVEAWGQIVQRRGPGDTALVIAGHWDPRYPQARRRAAELGLEASVTFLPDVAEADLPALYGGALALAFPSLYEGFGLPPLEAMACGTPVLCGQSSSLPEVVGDAALLVDPTSVDALADGLEQLLDDPALRQRLRAAGVRRAARFSWRATAEATLAVYEQT